MKQKKNNMTIKTSAQTQNPMTFKNALTKSVNYSMKLLQVLKAAFLCITVLLASCKKNDNHSPTEDNSIELLKNNNWKVAASLTREKYQGVLGGGFQTAALNLQKQDELRWCLWFADMSSRSDPTEFVLNTQNNVSIQQYAGSAATDFRSIKTIYGGDTWETHIPWYSGYNIAMFKNNQRIDLTLDTNATNIKNIVMSEDGLLNNSEVSGGTNTVSHYHYGTGKWKTNAFWAWNFVSVRYNNRTYVISLSKNTNQDGITVLSETDNKKTSSQGHIYYDMKPENYLDFSPVGFLMHTAQYGENVFVALDAYGNKFEVYKINLTNFTIQRVLNETKAVPYSQLANEIDAEGNLYVVEVRTENQKPFYSIRKYAVSGGNEVLLKETDLLTYTQIHALKYFAGKLHVAVVYKQDVPDNNPDDNSFHYKYHMQIICPK